MGGWNNNPDIIFFLSALTKILYHGYLTSSKRGNALPLEPATFSIFELKNHRRKISLDSTRTVHQEEEMIDKWDDLKAAVLRFSLSPFQRAITG